jgi:hypothetical protein
MTHPGPEDRYAPLRHRNRWQFPGPHIDLHRPRLASRSATLRAEPATVVIDPSRTALVVVDLQNDFCAPGGWLHGIGVDVSVLAAAVGLSAQAVSAARAADVPVIWLNWGNRPDQANLPPGVAHVYDPAGTGEGIGSRTAGNGSPVLTKDAWGAALVDGLVAEPQDIHVDKYRMSGFWDTPLDSILRNRRLHPGRRYGTTARPSCPVRTGHVPRRPHRRSVRPARRPLRLPGPGSAAARCDLRDHPPPLVRRCGLGPAGDLTTYHPGPRAEPSVRAASKPRGAG